MNPTPIVIGLTICEKAIVEERTKNVTLVSIFSKVNLAQFPSSYPFVAYADLTEGFGIAIIDLVVASLDNEEVIYNHQVTEQFVSPLAEQRILIRVNGCIFPQPGKYQVSLFVDGEPLVRRILTIGQREVL